MKALIQRVSSASVVVENEVVGKIGKGLLIFLGIRKDDTAKEADLLAEKIAHLRIFTDDAGKMNLSMKELQLEALVVSQFTLYANLSGRRPDFIQAAPPGQAEPLYQEFTCALQKKIHQPIATGRFGAKMDVQLVNDGPVTLLLEINNN